MNLRQILRAKGQQVFSIAANATLMDVACTLAEHNVGSLVVTEDGRMVGIITERDILRACAGRRLPLATLSVAEHMTTEVVTAHPDDSVSDIMGLMTRQRIRHLPVLESEALAGMISIGDIVKAQHDQLCLENEYLMNYIQS